MIHPQLETANSNTYAQNFGSMERVQSLVLKAPPTAQPEGKMRFEAEDNL
jgi:hypothetical protein